MGHVNTEMIMRHYGKWLPDPNKMHGYTSAIDWGKEMAKITQNDEKTSQKLPSKTVVN